MRQERDSKQTEVKTVNGKCWLCEDTDTGAPDWGQLQCWFWISRKHGKIKSKFQQQHFIAHFMRIRCKNHDSGFMCLFYVFPPKKPTSKRVYCVSSKYRAAKVLNINHQNWVLSNLMKTWIIFRVLIRRLVVWFTWNNCVLWVME